MFFLFINKMAFQGKISEKELKYRSSDDSLWLVPPPQDYNNWLIWPNTILNNMELSGCNDTINGICLQNKTLEECISECHGDCGAGRYFKFITGKSICVPIRTQIHPNLNPVYRLRKQEYYDLLPDKVNVSVFINKNKFSYPPALGNTIFYYDFLTIKNIEKKSYIEIENRKKNNFLYFSPNDSNSTIQIIPIVTTGGKVESNLPILYGDKFNLIIPGTNLIATLNTKLKNTLEWIIAPVDITKISKTYFSFLPLSKTKKIGDVVDYQEQLLLGYGDNIIYLDTMLKIKNFLKKNNTENSKFSIISRMIGFYCGGGNCNQVPIKDIDKNGKYHDSVVYRHKGCWNRCIQQNIKSSNTKINTSIIIGIIIGIIIIGIIIFYNKFS